MNLRTGRSWHRALLYAFIMVVGLVVIAWLADLFAGRPPVNIGVREGALVPCPATPNCVSSTAKDAEHAIAPLAFTGDAKAALARLAGVVAAQPRATLVEQSDRYLRAEFRSAAIGFVDDVEFLLDTGAGVIHVRSASRLGRRDFGVNRSRVESLRAAFAAAG